MKNRESLYPGRVKLTTVDEANGIYDMERADQPVEEGTPLNKRLLDFAVAACGVTSGTSTAFTLDDEFGGFELVDGAKVNFKLHVDPQGAVTLNVNGTGDKPLLTSRGSPALIGQSEGDWVTAVYSELKGAYLVSGGGLLPQIIVVANTGDTITVTNGKITLSATCDGSDVIFDIPDYGEWTVTNGALSRVMVVDAVKQYLISMVILTLDNSSWEDIKQISDEGLASSYWSVGDRKAVALNGTVGSLSLSGTYYCYIIGIDHNSGKEGTNRIHFQFGYSAASGGVHLAFIDSGYGNNQTSGAWFNMNNANHNSGGWKNSLMRTVICPAFKNAMPSDLQAVLKATTKYSDNTGGGVNNASYVTSTTDTVFLLAELEVRGILANANGAERNYQVQYAWYSAGNSKVRYSHSVTTSATSWWLRSVNAVNSYFCCITNSGDESATNANESLGFAPAFCV